LDEQVLAVCDTKLGDATRAYSYKAVVKPRRSLDDFASIPGLSGAAQVIFRSRVIPAQRT